MPIPANAPADHWARRQEEKRKKSSKHKVVKAALDNPVSEEVMDWVMREAAFQTAKLRYEAEQAELNGELDLGVVGKLLKSLELLGNAWLRRRAELGSKTVDVRSREFQALMDLLVDKFRAAMSKSSLPAAQVDSVLTHFAAELDGWEEEAAAKLKNLNAR